MECAGSWVTTECIQRLIRLLAIPLSLCGALRAADATAASAAEDGMYVADRVGTPTAPAGIVLKKCHLYSTDNANQRYELTGSCDRASVVDGKTYVVELQDRAYVIYGWGRSADECDFGVEIPASASAAAARAFDCTAVLRRHPGYRLDAVFTPIQAAYAPGDPLVVHFVLTNVGDQPFTFCPDEHRMPDRDESFDFALTAGPAMMVPLLDPGGCVDQIVIQKTLGPGESFTEDVDLGKWYTLNVPGSYFFNGMYQFSCYQRGDQSLWPVWEDIITRPFSVVIRKP
jgi:hypothetical protein